MIQGVSIMEMVNQSVAVLTQPNVETFRTYENRGGMREAVIYVGAAAAVVAIVGFIFGLLDGFAAALGGLIIGFIIPIIGFFVFAFVLYMVAQMQGGVGTQDRVFYSVSLFVAPILAITGIIGRIPFLGCVLLPVTLALLLYQAYLAYLATRSSMGVEQGPAIISVIAAIVAQIVVGAIIAGILGAVLVGTAVARGLTPW